ncbi:CBS domain-containing protein [Roseomonas sp. KE0001]|uniref:CBS domain-containing protein n=1 Tax=unclassified Roseomonas TaxID=2617492 RepID=UPI0018DFA3A9|nr:CBS domain-containing protein [Roseomonas sp. KE0001]MBI0433813.1 CBS domain-containing protein [Roseomonas sp. KE0001]
MTISRILRDKGTEVVSVAPEDDAIAIARVLARHGIGAALVRDDTGRILGIVSERDIVRALARDEAAAARLPATRLMTAVRHTVLPETRITEALAKMTEERVRHLPVMEAEQRLIGIVSIGDLVKARIADAENEASALRDYVTSA